MLEKIWLLGCHVVANGVPAMSDAVDQTQQEFWRPPIVEAAGAPALAVLPTVGSAACSRCNTEFLIGSHFCHACGAHRPDPLVDVQAFWQQKLRWMKAARADILQGNFQAPRWLRYLHFHEIKRGVGLPTAAFIAFMIGLGCVAGAIGVGLVYKASNMAEFQAVQLWRIEWLLAATASFVAGILLKKSANDE
jgi:hypothetical protein